MAHSILPPSGASVWAHCSGQPLMALMHPEPSSQDSRDGDAAHWVAATVLQSFRDQHGSLKLGSDLIGTQDPAGTLITQEIYDSAKVYVDDVLDHCNRHGGMDRLMVEHRVMIPRVHAENWGTFDCGWYAPGRLIIWDFKHGHEWIDPIWNWQLTDYLAGLLDELGVNGLADQQLQVEFRIVQPRCFITDGPVQTFVFTASDARAPINKLRSQAEAAMSGDAELVAGAHCRHCAARHVCPTLRKETMFALDYVGKPVPDVLTAEGLSFELSLIRRLRKVMEAKEEALETEATIRALNGEFIPGFTLDRRLGKRKFRGAAESVIEYGKMFGVDLSRSRDVVTPSEAERLFGANGLDPKMLEAHLDRPVTGTKLVAAEDSQAIRVFARTTPQPR